MYPKSFCIGTVVASLGYSVALAVMMKRDEKIRHALLIRLKAANEALGRCLELGNFEQVPSEALEKILTDLKFAAIASDETAQY